MKVRIARMGGGPTIYDDTEKAVPAEEGVTVVLVAQEAINVGEVVQLDTATLSSVSDADDRLIELMENANRVQKGVAGEDHLVKGIYNGVGGTGDAATKRETTVTGCNGYPITGNHAVAGDAIEVVVAGPTMARVVENDPGVKGTNCIVHSTDGQLVTDTTAVAANVTPPFVLMDTADTDTWDYLPVFVNLL